LALSAEDFARPGSPSLTAPNPSRVPRQKRKRATQTPANEPESELGATWGPPVAPSVVIMGAIYRLTAAIDTHNAQLTTPLSASRSTGNSPQQLLPFDNPVDKELFDTALMWLHTLFSPSFKAAKDLGYINTNRLSTKPPSQPPNGEH